MKYLLLLLGAYLVYRFYFQKPKALNRREEPLQFEQPQDRDKDVQSDEEYIDYEEVD